MLGHLSFGIRNCIRFLSLVSIHFSINFPIFVCTDIRILCLYLNMWKKKIYGPLTDLPPLRKGLQCKVTPPEADLVARVRSCNSTRRHPLGSHGRPTPAVVDVPWVPVALSHGSAGPIGFSPVGLLCWSTVVAQRLPTAPFAPTQSHGIPTDVPT
jgi:hypothetical protein